MFNITELKTNDGFIKTTDARELHERLGIGRDFSSWIKPLLEQFNDGYDYVSVAGAVPQNGGTARKEYALSINTAKHIALQAKSDVGKLIRQWYIDLESKHALPTTYREALIALVAEVEAKELAQAQLTIAAPKVAVYEQLADRKEAVNTTTVAKALGITATELNKFLRKHGVKWQAEGKDLPRAGYEDWFNFILGGAKNGKEYQQTLVSPKGVIEITKLYNKHKDA